MKQYRLTSSDFVQNDQGFDDAVMDAEDLSRLQQLAGIPQLQEAKDKKANATYSNPGGLKSPVGSNISYTANEKRRLEKEHNIKPGTPEWFQLWFSLPYLTGEKPVGKESAGSSNTLMSVNVTPPSR